MKNKDVIKSFLMREENKVAHLFTSKLSGERFGLFSYGRHFPLAISLKDGTMIINSSSYSQTTARHKGEFVRLLGFKDYKDFLQNYRTHNNQIFILNNNEMITLSLSPKILTKLDFINSYL